MNAERGGRRTARHSSGPRRRRRWFGPAMAVFFAASVVAVVRSPRAGQELSSPPPTDLAVAEAAPIPAGPPLDPIDSDATTDPAAPASSVAPTTSPTPSGAPVPPSTAAATPAASPSTTSSGGPAGPGTSAPETLAASDLASFFVALGAGDLVGAFDHLGPDHQRAVGGYEPFRTLWSVPAVISHDWPTCVADDDAFECAVTFRVYSEAGACASAIYSYRLKDLGTRHSIIGEQFVAERSCPGRVPTTVPTG